MEICFLSAFIYIQNLFIVIFVGERIYMDLRQWFSIRLSRRRAIRNFGLLAGAGLSIDAGIFAASKVYATKFASKPNPINHILIACQENHSFDNYFGYYPRAGAFGVPSNYSQPDGNGGKATPQHAFLPITLDPSHTWQSIHSEWNNGAYGWFLYHRWVNSPQLL